MKGPFQKTGIFGRQEEYKWNQFQKTGVCGTQQEGKRGPFQKTSVCRRQGECKRAVSSRQVYSGGRWTIMQASIKM
jgi:hypothetical protein